MNSLHSTLVCIPTYQEQGQVIPLVEMIFRYVPNSHVLFVDDNSTDGTKEEIAYLCDRFKGQVFACHRRDKQGLGTAYVTGFRWALNRNYAKIVEMDADFSHDPKYLPTMLSELDRFDVAVGSRYVKGGGTENWSRLRKLISLGGSWYSRQILGINLHDFTGGFNGWRSEVLKRIDIATLQSDGYAFQIELKYRAIRAGFSFKEFPIVFADRRAGQSKMSIFIVLEAIWRVWLFRFRALKSR